MLKAQRQFIISMILISLILIFIVALISINSMAYAEPTSYSISWLDDDDTVLRIDNIEEGELPSYGENPTKAETNSYYYEFSHWEPSIVVATEDTSYKAVYTATPKYAITWNDDNDDLLRTDYVIEGQTPSYGENPTKVETNEYYYEFSHWEPEVVAATTAAIYTAVFTATPKYEITWYSDTNTLLRTDYVIEGETPNYGTNPTKAEDEIGVYTFIGWTPSIVAATENASYTAIFDVTYKYTITWNDYDDSLLKEEVYFEGETPEYGADPTRAEDDAGIYAFSGWTPNVVTVTGDATYTAVYDITHKYYIHLYDEKIEGTTPIDILDLETNKIYDILELQKAEDYLNYSYKYEDETLLNKDAYLTGEVNIIRIAMYEITFYRYINELVQGQSTAYYAKGDVLNLVEMFSDEKFTTQFKYKNSTSQDISIIVNSENVVLNDCSYIYQDKIYISVLHSKIPVLVRNDQNSITTTVYYLFPYESLFSNPYKKGYTFTGWTYKGQPVNTNTIVNTKSEHRLIASFIPNSYSITFHITNEATNNINVYYDGAIAAVDAPKKTGYTFRAWQLDGEDFDVSKAYTLTKNIELYPSFTPNAYKANYIVNDSKVSIDVLYDSENISLDSNEIQDYLKDNIVVGMYYLQNGKRVPICDKSLIIPKWQLTNDIDLYITAISRNEDYNSKYEIVDLSQYKYKYSIDEENVDLDSSYQRIGNHTYKVLDENNNIVVEGNFTIKEEFSFETETTYISPIYFTNIEADVYVDGEKVEDLSSFRIDSAGEHLITVVGSNGYKSEYIVTYDNKNLSRGWWIFGIACAFLLGGIVLIILGRRKVVMYYGKH